MVQGGDGVASKPYKTSWGDPVVTVRIPRPVIDALKKMAADEGVAYTAVLRNLVEKELKAKGYVIAEKPIDGQIKIE